MTTDELVEQIALGITQEIGWGTFSHFDPRDVRRIARAALQASGLEAQNERLRGALTEAADTFSLMAGAMREIDPELLAQVIGVAELSADEARQALTTIKQESSDAS